MTGSDLLSALAAFVLGYALGSIPFGLLLTKIAGTTDIRSIGSGNIGATNVLRTGRRGLAAATLLCDILKGTLAVILADRLFSRDFALVAGVGAFFGHLFPVWLKFKGGKGVATYIGILIGVDWRAALAFCAIWLGIAAVSRYSSLSALVASALTPAILAWLGDITAAQVFILLTLMVYLMHRANIARLLAGTEGKIGKKSEATG